MEKDNKGQRMAFLISAYTEPKSLHALIRKLDHMLEADFFVHIDLKVDEQPFRCGLDDLPNVSFIKDRVRVYWGGYSQVKMQMAMIKAMLLSNVRYTRVINLTGTDYPVAGKRTLVEKLGNTQIEYISGFDIGREPKSKKGRMEEKYSYFYYMDSHRFIRGAIKRLRIPRLSYRKSHMPMYFGSEYWALTYDCIKELYWSYLKNETLQRLLRYSFVPSETWIHTLFFNSKWSDRAIQKPSVACTDLIALSPVTYFKYEKKIKILDENDYDDIMNSKRLFARKIIVGKSDKLITMLPA